MLRLYIICLFLLIPNILWSQKVILEKLNSLRQTNKIVELKYDSAVNKVFGNYKFHKRINPFNEKSIKDSLMISLNYGGIYDYNVFITDIKVKKNKEVIPDIEKFLNRVLFKRKLYNALTDSEYNYVAFTGFCKQKKCFLRIFLFKRFLDLETPKYNSEIGGIHGDEYTYYIEIQGESLIYKDLFYFIKSNQDGTKLLPYNKEKQAIEIKSDNTFDFIIESKLVKSIIITNNNNDILSQILLLKLF